LQYEYDEMLAKAIDLIMMAGDPKYDYDHLPDDADADDSDEFDNDSLDGDGSYERLLAQIDQRLLIMTQEDADAAIERSRYLPYYVQDNTAIEWALAMLLNEHVLDIRVQKIMYDELDDAMSEEERRYNMFIRQLNDQWSQDSGEYMVGSLIQEIASIHLVAGFLFVEQGFEWVDALEYFEQRLQMENRVEKAMKSLEEQPL
jgi:hypothetical protein